MLKLIKGISLPALFCFSTFVLANEIEVNMENVLIISADIENQINQLNNDEKPSVVICKNQTCSNKLSNINDVVEYLSKSA